MKLIELLTVVEIFICASTSEKYLPTWESLDKRPLPQWYDDAKIGIFIHWGIYSVPSFGTEWFWSNWKKGTPQYVNFMRLNYPPGFTYQDFAKDFKAEFYDPDQWARLFQQSGAKYVVLTSKHHDGYSLWPSTYSFSWNSQDVGPKRDLLGDLAKSIRNLTTLKFGLYHSLYEWFNPVYLKDKSQNFQKNAFSANKVYPEMLELVEKYAPEIFWSDGEWEAPYTYWNSTQFIAWLYNDSPVKETIVVNDRWGSGNIICQHGDFYTCADRFNPGVLQSHKWENAMTIDKKSWGYRRNANLTDYLTTYELLATLVITVSCGGNILINVGPRSDGIIDLIFQERLLDMGSWLNINGEAVYSSKPWIFQNDTIGNTWYTTNKQSVYAFTLFWPYNNVLELGRAHSLFVDSQTVVSLLGNADQLQWIVVNGRVRIYLPDKAAVASQWVWVLKITTPKLFR